MALHRTAYLLYADPRLGHRRGGVLVVGPHQPYLAYVCDVLPSLGEEGVQTCTLRDLVPEGEGAVEETDGHVARLKASLELVRAIELAVGLYEEPPTTGLSVTTAWDEVWVATADWAAAFEAQPPGVPHNEARDVVWDELLTIITDRHVNDEASPDLVRRSLEQNRELRTTLDRAWPTLEAADLVGDLWTVPAYLRRCAPGLSTEDVRRLQRLDPTAWTLADFPLLDTARQRLGDPDASRRRRQQGAVLAAQREETAKVVDHLIESDDSERHVMSMLHGQDLGRALVDESVGPVADPDLLAGPFAHIVVDEAQELTDAQWQMLLNRCPSRSFTVVGDRAQARHGFTESWQKGSGGSGSTGSPCPP